MLDVGLEPLLTSFPYASKWCVVISDLNTTIQLAFCDLSISKFANDGIDTFGSFVQWTRSEKKIKLNFNRLVLFGKQRVGREMLFKHNLY